MPWDGQPEPPAADHFSDATRIVLRASDADPATRLEPRAARAGTIDAAPGGASAAAASGSNAAAPHAPPPQQRPAGGELPAVGGGIGPFDFETDLFVGRMHAVFRLPAEHMAPGPAAALAGKKRLVWFCFQVCVFVQAIRAIAMDVS